MHTPIPDSADIDRLVTVHASTLSRADVDLLRAVVSLPPESYRHGECAARLFALIMAGRVDEPIDTLARLLDVYPPLRANPALAPYISNLLDRCDSITLLAELYDKLSLCPAMGQAALRCLFHHPQLLDELPSHADTRLSRDLQPSIQANVQRVPDEWKVAHIAEPYFGLTADDLNAILRSAETSGNTRLYARAVERNAATVDARHLRAYILIAVADQLLSDLPEAVFGPDATVLDARLIGELAEAGYFVRVPHSFTDALTLLDAHQRLTPEARQAFVGVAEAMLPHPTLTQLGEAYCLFAALLPEYFTPERIAQTTALGSGDTWETLPQRLKAAGADKQLRQLFDEHAQELLLAACPTSLDDLIHTLSLSRLPRGHFIAINTPEDVFALCPNMTVDDYIRLYRYAHRQEKALRRLKKWKPIDQALADYALGCLPLWFEAKSLTSSLYVKTIAPLPGREAKRFALAQMKRLDDDALRTLADKATAYLRRPSTDDDAHTRQLVQPVLDALVPALKRRRLLPADSPLLAAAHAQAGFSVTPRTFRIAAIAALALIVVGALIIALATAH